MYPVGCGPYSKGAVLPSSRTLTISTRRHMPTSSAPSSGLAGAGLGWAQPSNSRRTGAAKRMVSPPAAGRSSMLTQAVPDAEVRFSEPRLDRCPSPNPIVQARNLIPHQNGCCSWPRARHSESSAAMSGGLSLQSPAPSSFHPWTSAATRLRGLQRRGRGSARVAASRPARSLASMSHFLKLA